MSQLRMIFNAAATPLPSLSLPAGFRLRTLTDQDLAQYNALRQSAGFGEWDENTLRSFQHKALPGGWLLLEEAQSDRFAASAAAESSDFPEYPGLGVLGWVMTSPDFRGRHLGRQVSIAAMHRLYAAGYRAFSLLTDDFRLPAIATYLKLSWRPWLYADDMEERWRKLAPQLGTAFEHLQAYPREPLFPPPDPPHTLRA
ncbi:MAG: GNAT family N-acetyltransferase [Oligosphaeraceae bacterium]|nr:GNAT family N-acetyltransferase [Oligosphaeraceae bacterium]